MQVALKTRGVCLKKGLVADFVILEGNLDPENPPVVAETWKAGRKVYSKGMR
jgi:hypothetical protein